MKEYENKIEEIDDSINPVPRVDLKNVWGYFEVVSSVPTETPTNFINQIKIYVNGGDFKLYIYDNSNNVWRSLENYIPPAP